MNKHKFRTAVLLSVMLCFIIVSPVFIQGTSAYIFGQSPICRSSFYGEPGESSVPESSIPESSFPESSVPESSTTTRTGDGTNTLPIISLLFFSVVAIISVFAALKQSKKHRNIND